MKRASERTTVETFEGPRAHKPRRGAVALVVPMALAGLAALVGFGPSVLDAARTATADGKPAAAPHPVVACAPLDLMAATPGSHVKATATLGPTVATLEGTAAEAWGLPALGAPTLTIHEGATTVRSGPVDAPAGWEGPGGSIMLTGIQNPTPAPPGGEATMLPLCVARFSSGADAGTATLIGLYTGGAHCCTTVRAYRANGAPADAGVGNAGVDVRAHGDRAILVTEDDVFNYEFDAYAASGAPVKVLELRGGAFADTTREYPDLVRSDAIRWWDRFNENAPRGLGFLAAWVADKCLLNEGAEAWTTVDKLLADGKLAGPAVTPGDPNAGEIWPAGADYVAKLRAFMPEHGYCR